MTTLLSSHFIDGETEAKKLSDLFEAITSLSDGGI